MLTIDEDDLSPPVNKNIELIKAWNAEINQKINVFYKEAVRLSEKTGIPHEVDHIIPISKGGKHHENNLQILTAIENRKKYNKLYEQ